MRTEAPKRLRTNCYFNKHLQKKKKKGTSAASERAFSQSGRIISTDRCSLSAESITILMMEKCRLSSSTEVLRNEMNKILGRKQVLALLIIRLKEK